MAQLCRSALTVGAVISLSGCASYGVCGKFKPVYLEQKDKVADSTARQIVGNNEYGEQAKCPGFVPVQDVSPFHRLLDGFNRTPEAK